MNSIPSKFENDFFSGKKGELVKFCINDSVNILSGPYKGKSGAVISISSIEPEVVFVVELGDGTGDVKLAQSILKIDEGKEEDWRLQGQEKYLKSAKFQYIEYIKSKDNWDHDHCSFCYAKFMEKGNPDSLHEGYTTEDHYHWVCTKCFEDFKDLFAWKLISQI